MDLATLVKSAAVVGLAAGVIAIIGYFRGPPPKEEPKQKGGGRGRGGGGGGRQPQQESDLESDNAEQFVEAIREMANQKDWNTLAEIFFQQKIAGLQNKNLEQLIFSALMEVGYRYNAGRDADTPKAAKEHHEKAKTCALEFASLLHGMGAPLVTQLTIFAELVLYFGYYKESEEIVKMALEIYEKIKTKPDQVLHLQNILANIMASTDRVVEGRALMENIRGSLKGNPPLGTSRYLVGQEASFQMENGKPVCNVTFKKNGGSQTDPPEWKTTQFAVGMTLKCKFEHPEAGKPPLEKVFTMHRANLEEFNLTIDYPSCTKGALYLLEVEVYEDDEQTEKIGHHFVLVPCEVGNDTD